MLKKFVAALALAAGVSAPALADPKEYAFTAVEEHVAVAKASTLRVRLVHVPTGQPVTTAIVFQPRLEMPMDGMAPMATAVKAGQAEGDGIYPFVADLSMAGPWTLTVSAKVQGEAATITGSVPFTAVGAGHRH